MIKIEMTPAQYQSMVSDLEAGRQAVNEKLTMAMVEYQNTLKSDTPSTIKDEEGEL